MQKVFLRSSHVSRLSPFTFKPDLGSPVHAIEGRDFQQLVPPARCPPRGGSWQGHGWRGPWNCCCGGAASKAPAGFGAPQASGGAAGGGGEGAVEGEGLPTHSCGACPHPWPSGSHVGLILGELGRWAWPEAEDRAQVRRLLAIAAPSPARRAPAGRSATRTGSQGPGARLLSCPPHATHTRPVQTEASCCGADRATR